MAFGSKTLFLFRLINEDETSGTCRELRTFILIQTKASSSELLNHSSEQEVRRRTPPHCPHTSTCGGRGAAGSSGYKRQRLSGHVRVIGLFVGHVQELCVSVSVRRSCATGCCDRHSLDDRIVGDTFSLFQSMMLGSPRTEMELFLGAELRF